VSIKLDTCPLLPENKHFMQRDSYSTLSHFLEDPDFRNWVIAGTEDDDWQTWVEQNPGKAHLVQDARYFLLAIGGKQEEPSVSETEESLRHSWHRIHQKEKRPRRWSRLYWKVSAASLALATALFFYLVPATKKGQTDTPLSKITRGESDIEVTNHNSETRLINLADGTSILLQPGSSISHPATFDSDSRKVYLSGDAFFEVSKDPLKPFFVYTADIITEVKGTSFRIKAIPDQPLVQVFVKTGEVNVTRANPGVGKSVSSIALYPNESILYLKKQNAFERSVAPNHPSNSIDSFSFDFVDAPIGKIFETIEKVYNIKINYPKEPLAGCYLSTSLDDEPLLEKLKIICESLGANSSFSMTGNNVSIQSNGCN
jgi:transmembrane sensor